MAINVTVDGTTYSEIETITAGGKTLSLSADPIHLQQKTATANGEVVPDSGYDGLSKVVVSVPGGGGSTLISKSITANGTYHASSDSADGYSSVEVAVPQGTTPTGSQSITTNGTYDVTNIAQAVVNVSGGGGLPNIETGTYTITAQNVTDKSFEFNLQNAADIVFMYPANQAVASSLSSYCCLTFDIMSQAMAEYLTSNASVSVLPNQVYACGVYSLQNGLLMGHSEQRTSDALTGVYGTTVKWKATTQDHTLTEGTWNYIAVRGITS